MSPASQEPPPPPQPPSDEELEAARELVRQSRDRGVALNACGEVRVDVPRDRESTFSPVIVKKRQRRLSDVDEVVLSLYAKGSTTCEISSHFADVYDASVSKDTVSAITDRVLEEMQAWWARPLERVFAAIFIDAITVKIRDGQVGKPPHLRGHRGGPGRAEGHPGDVGRRRRW